MRAAGKVHGDLVDRETRCVHYYSKLDIIAIKFYCCGKYYSCFYCHQKEDHPVKRWPVEKYEEKAILCGVCDSELSIRDYKKADYCPNCESLFNPGCANHYHLYFE